MEVAYSVFFSPLVQIFLSALIDVAGHAGRVDAAFDVLEEARTCGMHLGIVSYSSLMGACCNVRLSLVLKFLTNYVLEWN